MEAISSTVVLPVTDAQMRAFGAWVIETYVTYDVFMDAIKSPAVDTYIKTHILPHEMQSVLHRAEPFIGKKRGDIYVYRLLIDRRRVIAKMNNLKGKIATMLFPIEAAQTRRDKRATALYRRQLTEATRIRLDQQAVAYRDYMIERLGRGLPFPEINLPTIVKIQLSDEDAKTCVMDDNCVICLAQHKMTEVCKINCGHQFGSVCLAKWKKDTCPLCRTEITEKTVFIDSYLKDAEIEQIAVVA
jgi:hypothetical protein